MAYVAVAKALYDYEAQDPETELAFKEDQLIYVIEKEDDDWWKAKLKDEPGTDGPVGLIPASYVEEIPAINQTRAIYAYDSTSPEELSITEESLLHVYSIEDDWLLVRLDAGRNQKLGFVPRTYCEPLDASAEVEVTVDAAEVEAEKEEAEDEERHRRQLAEQQRVLRAKDKVETWSVSEVDGKKKKKGTLGVGNGAVFFASDTDKMTPVKQYNITELARASQPSSKIIELTFTAAQPALHLHCGSSSNASAILMKLESSKAAAGEALELAAHAGGASSEEEDNVPPVSEAKSVRWAAAAPAAASGVSATVLYEFDAQGEDELSVKEGEEVTVTDRENDEWWSVRNASGREGVVPAQYVQLNDGSAPAPVEEDDGEDEARRAEEEAAAAAALEQERRKSREQKANQRRAIEQAAREKERQEEEDRKFAEEVQEKERGKAERRARRREEESRNQREAEAAERREAARERSAPPKIAKRPSAQDVTRAAKDLPARGHAAPARPPENARPKPTPGRTRVWSDKTGQFRVEAEYLGVTNGKVRLHKLNGVIIEVPIEKLSTEDVQLLKRHEARKARAAQAVAPPDDDDLPLANTRRGPPPSRSEETVRRASSPPIPAAALEMPKPRKPRFDWFAFFLDAGCGMDDCTRYAAAFDRDGMAEDILPDLESSTLRSLGLKEGDVIRVKRTITQKYAKKTPEQEAQIKLDEDYARSLQEHENSGSKGPAPTPPPGLFTGPDGKLANNTRRGRPEKKSTGADTVDAASLAAASDQLKNVSISSPSPPPPAPPAPVEEKKPQPLLAGFDDDAWAIKPTSKPASPAPPLAQPQATPAANTTESLLAQIQALRPASTGIQSNNTGGSGNFQNNSSPQRANVTGSSGFSGPSSYGLGVQNTGQAMSNMVNPNAPRAPMAPVKANEGLLNPLQPVQTGFIPTRGGVGGFGNGGGMMPQQTGFMPQQQQQLSMQPTGYAQGFTQAYGAQQVPGQIAPNYTGYGGGFPQQPQQQSAFNAIASLPPPQPQQNGDKFAPSNIFSAMKRQDFGKPEEQQPQSSNKYDSLRPLTTGYNGAPGMIPQQTGMMMPQQTGYNPQAMGMMGQQQTGMMGQQQTGMYPQQTGMMGMNGGMMSQMTGYNPQMGYMQGQQNPYGQGGYR